VHPRDFRRPVWDDNVNEAGDHDLGHPEEMPLAGLEYLVLHQLSKADIPATIAGREVKG
jgi:hypothetical protein